MHLSTCDLKLPPECGFDPICKTRILCLFRFQKSLDGLKIVWTTFTLHMKVRCGQKHLDACLCVWNASVTVSGCCLGCPDASLTALWKSMKQEFMLLQRYSAILRALLFQTLKWSSAKSYLYLYYCQRHLFCPGFIIFQLWGTLCPG